MQNHGRALSADEALSGGLRWSSRFNTGQAVGDGLLERTLNHSRESVTQNWGGGPRGARGRIPSHEDWPRHLRDRLAQEGVPGGNSSISDDQPRGPGGGDARGRGRSARVSAGTMDLVTAKPGNDADVLARGRGPRREGDASRADARAARKARARGREEARRAVSGAPPCAGPLDGPAGSWTPTGLWSDSDLALPGGQWESSLESEAAHRFVGGADLGRWGDGSSSGLFSPSSLATSSEQDSFGRLSQRLMSPALDEAGLERRALAARQSSWVRRRSAAPEADPEAGLGPPPQFRRRSLFDRRAGVGDPEIMDVFDGDGDAGDCDVFDENPSEVH